METETHPFSKEIFYLFADTLPFMWPEEQKGGRFQKKIWSTVFVVDIVACCIHRSAIVSTRD